MEGIINDLNIKYLKSLRSKQDPILKDISDYAVKNKVPIVSSEVAKFLELITLIKDPDKVLEIGTAVGFSGITIARALKTSGKLTTIELSKPCVEIAKENFARAGVKNKVRIIFGDALRVLPKLEDEYDMAFIDARKESYQLYLTHTISLMKHGGVIIVDNLLWSGKPAGGPSISEENKAATTAIKKFNKFFLKHPALTSTILSVGDGIGLAIVK